MDRRFGVGQIGHAKLGLTEGSDLKCVSSVLARFSLPTKGSTISETQFLDFVQRRDPIANSPVHPIFVRVTNFSADETKMPTSTR